MQQDFKQTRLKELEKIIENEQDNLFRFAYMRIGSREDAEDVVQDAFPKTIRFGRKPPTCPQPQALLDSLHQQQLSGLSSKEKI